jgi:pimeloyl-ACP methyl ester carboxylesterase
MNHPARQLARSVETATEVAQVLQTRARQAVDRFGERARNAADRQASAAVATPQLPWQAWLTGTQYAVDVAQRSVLFWDTLRQRGNNFVEHERQGLPPLLHFEHELVMDGRELDVPVNYALLRILPPPGMTVDPKRRPYVIIDPRGGHGPGIGGFKDDSQVGVALRQGHPVYFVVFFRDPEPGQTLLDVCRAECGFVRKVRTLHPKAPKPALIGNCQGGWSAMMVAAASPDDTGPVVIVGAPMSYWAGAWREGSGDNPMRYAGGLLGGTWLASLAADLGAGKFDGAWLVQNFENLNPANTFCDKYYNVFANIDTEAARFLEFERWWGGYFLLNAGEIEWITQNLFIGNTLWTDSNFDLRAVKSPIVLFASQGDNITPPQQAFNWVADVYGSTEEIKACGQVIVGLMHEDIGHLGIFVSGKVAKKEHAQIVSVLKAIEAPPPGLYGMEIAQQAGSDAKPAYDVNFVELRLEDVVPKLNRYQRRDEKPFEVLRSISEFNQSAYELFARPLVKAWSNEPAAQLLRALHPLRFQRWALSDLNPAMSWLAPAAQAVQAQRLALAADHPARRVEAAASELMSAALDGYRELRDAGSEAAFFHLYGNLFAFQHAEDSGADGQAPQAGSPRELPLVQRTLATVAQGGYPEALARVAFLLAHRDEPLPLSRLQLAHDLIEEYRDLLPELPPEEVRRIGGEQEIIARFEPEQAVETLPALLTGKKDRERLLTLLDRVLADRRVQRIQPSAQQKAMLTRIRGMLAVRGTRAPRLPAPATSTNRRAARMA